jgi:alpha-methylacyl-CoA racemase
MPSGPPEHDPTTQTSHAGPLAGLRVVELAGIGPAPYGAMLLADLGADVVRIDRLADAATDPGPEASPDLHARGKRSISLDLKREAHLDVARELIGAADVFLDPYRPGVAERLGLGPDECLERNPRLIYARMTGWGQDGPLSQAAGHDLNYIALAGALHPMGEPGAPPPVPLNLIGDFGGGGMLLAFGVLAALYERERSGLGQVLDVAMVDGVASLLASVCMLDAMGLWSRERGGNWLDGSAPWYRPYRTADGRYVTVGALEPQFYALLLEQAGLDAGEWPEWDTARWPALRERLEAVFATRTLAEWSELLEGTDVCFAPVLRIDEAASHPHLAARGTYVEREGLLQPGPVPRFSRTPGSIRRPPPWPGQHTAEVLAEVGALGPLQTVAADGVGAD